MMMDLSSGSHQLPLWYFLAKMRLLHRKVSCRSIQHRKEDPHAETIF
jgi:hypothetical protein